MTHCHSGSVVQTLVTAWNQGKKIHVYNTETRPLFQGRRTSTELVKAGVPNTMIVDDSAPFFVDNLYESEIDIDTVIIGCDAIKMDGGVYNKI
jgi:translation initiation factor 2B subunit (eIF-2B alpha/beta/delta family)